MLLYQKVGRLGPFLDPLNPPNYSIYQSYIKSRIQRNRPVPQPFAALIYRKAPEMALLAFLKAYDWHREKRKPVLWASHVIGDNIWKQEHGFLDPNEAEPETPRQLDKLSQHDTWWVRLYAAEILREHPAFATPETVERLKRDENELVRRTARSEESRRESHPTKRG